MHSTWEVELCSACGNVEMRNRVEQRIPTPHIRRDGRKVGTQLGIHRIVKNVAVLLCRESVIDTIKLRVGRLENLRRRKIELVRVRVDCKAS